MQIDNGTTRFRASYKIGLSYHLVAAAIVCKSRGDDPALIDISWHDLAQEVAKAATAYLNEAR